MKVCQRNFRKYMNLRNWGWFIIIQKTRANIGQPNPEEELRQLEEKANASYGVYLEQVETKKRLEQENIQIEEEKKALVKQLESEQGNMSEYTERQAKQTIRRLVFNQADLHWQQKARSATTDSPSPQSALCQLVKLK